MLKTNFVLLKNRNFWQKIKNRLKLKSSLKIRQRETMSQEHVNDIFCSLEFREMGGKPKLEWAWLCARLNGVCDEVAIPITIRGQGMWSCGTKRQGRTNVCRVVCFNGGNAFNGNAKARCDTFSNNVTTAGKWRTN